MNDYAPLFHKKMNEQKKREKTLIKVGTVVEGIGLAIIIILYAVCLWVLAVAFQ